MWKKNFPNVKNSPITKYNTNNINNDVCMGSYIPVYSFEHRNVQTAYKKLHTKNDANMWK